jgi:ubiquitin-conjugating enzyme (huntingtin interacting protein 2)
MLMRNPKEFERVAAEWAVKYAGAPRKDRGETSGGATADSLKKRQRKSKEQEAAERLAAYVKLITVQIRLLTLYRYGGYNPAMIDNFVAMGFDLDRVVAAFDFVGIDANGGEQYEMEEAYIGDITARLLGEP